MQWRTCETGQKAHMKAGSNHRCRSAAWNWNGMAKAPMRMSAMARLAMKKLVTVRRRRERTTTHNTTALPKTADTETAPYAMARKTIR